MEDLEKELEKSVGEIIIDLQREIRELEEENKKLKELKCIPTNLKTVIRIDEENEKLKKKLRRLEKEHKKLQVEHSRILFDMDAVIENEVKQKYWRVRKENNKLKEELYRITGKRY